MSPKSVVRRYPGCLVVVRFPAFFVLGVFQTVSNGFLKCFGLLLGRFGPFLDRLHLKKTKTIGQGLGPSRADRPQLWPIGISNLNLSQRKRNENGKDNENERNTKQKKRKRNKQPPRTQVTIFSTFSGFQKHRSIV